MIKVLFLICFIYITFAWKLFDREEAPSGWTMLERAEQHARIKLRIALRQHNLDKLEVCLYSLYSRNSPLILKYESRA